MKAVKIEFENTGAFRRLPYFCAFFAVIGKIYMNFICILG